MTSAELFVLRWEGAVDHLYLDQRGNVTIGVGHLTTNLGAALALPFIDRLSHERAVAVEIQSDFGRIARCEPGHTAQYYRRHTHLCLTQDDQLDLFRADLELVRGGLEKLFPGFPELPLRWRTALTDMGFNLGLGGLKRFRRLRAAVAAGDGETAAVESHRSTSRQERNDATAALFRSGSGAGGGGTSP